MTFDLEPFVDAQDRAGTYERAVAELRAGRKTSHWMWFVFPQLDGLGRSAMAQRYAITSLAQAAAYLQHPVLGPRLVDCAGIVASVPAWDAESIFGGIDAQKLHSSMTLFARAAPDEVVFTRVLDRFFSGVADPGTVRILDAVSPVRGRRG